MEKLEKFKNRKWKRQRNDNDAYLEDVNIVIEKVNEIIDDPGFETCVGAYTNLTELNETITDPVAGNFAIVGTTIYVWDAVGSEWISVGEDLYQGTVDATGDIDYPAATTGQWWVVSGAGKIGTKDVEVGDRLVALADYAGGADDTKFAIFQKNMQPKCIELTYAELQSLVSASELIPGQQYLITDFAQTYNIFDGGTSTVIEEQIGSTEPLIVKAISSSEIDEVAISVNHPKDIIHYSLDLLDNRDIGFGDGAGVPTANFKGQIYYREDTIQNVSTHYDFRNIKFRRWAIDATAYDGGTAYVAKDVCKSGIDGKIYKCIIDTTGEGDPTVNTTDWVLWLDITVDAFVSWTSDIASFNVGDINTDNLTILSYQDLLTFGSYYSKVKNVQIDSVSLDWIIDSFWGVPTALNNIIFKTEDAYNTCQGVKFGLNSFNFTIIGKLHTIDVMGYFNHNVFGEGFANTVIRKSYTNNMCGSMFQNNVIENYFYGSTIGDSFRYNTIKGEFRSSIIGNNFQNNTIGDNFNSNIIGNIFYSNTIGNSFRYNTVGNSFRYNTVGNSLYKTTFGDNCQYNTIANIINATSSSKVITFGDNVTMCNIQDQAFGNLAADLDLSTATHIRGEYNTTIYDDKTDGLKLSYMDAGVLTVANVTD